MGPAPPTLPWRGEHPSTSRWSGRRHPALELPPGHPGGTAVGPVLVGNTVIVKPSPSTTANRSLFRSASAEAGSHLRHQPADRADADLVTPSSTTRATGSSTSQVPSRPACASRTRRQGEPGPEVALACSWRWWQDAIIVDETATCHKRGAGGCQRVRLPEAKVLGHERLIWGQTSRRAAGTRPRPDSQAQRRAAEENHDVGRL